MMSMDTLITAMDLENGAMRNCIDRALIEARSYPSDDGQLARVINILEEQE